MSWQGHKSPTMGRNTRWTYIYKEGVEVRRVAHPTALRPYYIPGREDLGTFSKLTEAQTAALLGRRP